MPSLDILNTVKYDNHVMSKDVQNSTREARTQAKSAARRKQQKEALSQTILDAAAELFQKQGYQHFSLRQVAEAIGYSPTTIYLHFKDKDELLFNVAIQGFKTFGERLQTAYDNEDTPLARLQGIGKAYVDFGLSYPVHYRLMFMERGEFLLKEPPEGCESVIDAFEILIQTIKECISAGVIKKGDVQTYANTIWAVTHGIVALAISVPTVDEVDARASFETAIQMIQKGLG